MPDPKPSPFWRLIYHTLESKKVIFWEALLLLKKGG